MSSLNRTKQGNFLLRNSYTLEDIENGNYKVLDMVDVLDDIEKIVVDEEMKFRILNGQILKMNKDRVAFISEDNKLLGIYKRYDKDEECIKPEKIFN